MATYELFVSNTLLFTQDVTTDPKYAKGENYLNLQQSVSTNIKYVTVRQVLPLQQTVTRSGSVFNRSASDFLGMLHRAHPKAIDVSIVQNLFFTQSLQETHGSKNTLLINQSATAHVAKPAKNKLIFSQTVGLQRVISRSAEQTLALNQKAGIVPTSLCVLTTELDSPPVGRTDPFILNSTGVSSVTLEPPDFSNSEEFDFSNKNKRTRGGDLIVYRSDDWPKITKLTYSWSYLNRDEALDVIDFIKSTVGKVINFTDHETRSFQGIIINPETAVTQQGRKNYSFDLEIELLN